MNFDEEVLDKVIIEQLKSLKELVDKNFLPLKKEADLVMRDGIKDKKQIEYLLGGFLGYISLGVGLDEFRKLNAYYSMTNPQEADNFREYFEGILDISGL